MEPVVSSDEYRRETGIFQERTGYDDRDGDLTERSPMLWKDPFLLQVLRSSGCEMSYIWLIPLQIPSIWQIKYRIQMDVMLCRRLQDLELPTGISMRAVRS